MFLLCKELILRIQRITFFLFYTCFYKQPYFLLQARVAYGRIHFQPKSCLEVAYSIHFQPLVAWQLLIFNKFILPSFGLIGSRSFVSESKLDGFCGFYLYVVVHSSFFSWFVVFQKTVADFWWNFPLFFYYFYHLVG